MGTAPTRVGFLADTHSTKPDGSDLPDAVLKAFSKADLIVHLGDIGRKGILDRLAQIAPVLVPSLDGTGYITPAGDAAPVKVIDVGGLRVGLSFNVSKPDKKIAWAEDRLEFDGTVADLVTRRFKEAVSVVAFAGTHCRFVGDHDGVTFFNPGSPNLPSDGDAHAGRGSVAVLSVKKGKPAVDLVGIS